MAPVPKSRPSPPEPRLFSRAHAASPDDEVVITGIAGKFPSCENVQEFNDCLYNKIDMVDDKELRWRHFNVEIPRRMGKINDLEKFDATFFGVHFKQAHTMDPQCRLLIETAYEAVLDSGVNPRTLRGSRTGVFMGACFSESEKTWFYEKISSGGFGITGCSRAMLANRISYSLGLNGPSFLLDTACSSSMYAMDSAFTALRNGECDAALVGGANLLMHPYVTLQFARLGVLAPDGYCRPFDVDATGYTRSEAICVLFLQKAKDAKRSYGTVVYSKTNCDGYKEEGITYPSGKMQQKLLNEFYDDICIDPSTVSYVEAHSTGTLVGDPEECHAIDTVFCKNRQTPLTVGSVKSNIGHSESSSGACSIAKVVLAFETGAIAPNINFTRIRPGIPSLEEGRLKVCTEVTKLEGSLIGINSFGFGGANAHCLLRRNPKEKLNNGAPYDSLPRLINWSGRTEEAINVFLDSIETRPLDAEHVGLIHNIQSVETAGYIYRGYGLFEHTPNGNAKCISREVHHFPGVKRDVVWVFSGMGSQWPEMGTSLLEIPLCRASIMKSHEVLLPLGLNLLNIITNPEKGAFDNIMHSFVGIAAIQIAIVDVLKHVNLKCDYIVGHSVGELGCAYADGCLTAEQMILSSYSRGLASVQTPVIRGSMAAVGLGYKQIKNMLPASIAVACHNGPDSSTISGPDTDVAAFVADLKNKGIFAKEVQCSNIAYHSKYIADMGPVLLSSLKKIIPHPMRRSAKWLSSSVPRNRWDLPENQLSSAEYHTNNLLSSVLFEETCLLLPQNCLTLEIAPHGLLQAILKKSMKTSIHVPLTQRGNKSNMEFMFCALGKLFAHGQHLAFDRLYPAVQFPVSRGTPMISPYVRWQHSDDWFTTKFELQRSTRSGERKVKISLTDQDYDFISGHTIDGRVLFPATAYLQLVWETLAMMKGPIFFDMNVEFEDIRFLRATSLVAGQEVEFTITIHAGTGRFEITEGATAVVTGCITEVVNPLPLTTLPPLKESEFPIMQERDFYKELRLRGYHYNGAFRSVKQARGDGLSGRVQWDLNWVAFLDCLLQISIVAKDSRSLILPTRIQKMRINAKDHMHLTTKLNPEDPCFDVQVCPILGILIAGGIEIFGIHTSPVSRRKPPGYPVLESYRFIPHLPAPILPLSDAVRVCVQLALENNPMLKVKAVEVESDGSEPIITWFELALGDLPLVQSDLMLLTKQELQLGKIHVEDGAVTTQKNCLFVIFRNVVSRPELADQYLVSLSENGYLVSREAADIDCHTIQAPPSMQLIASLPTSGETLLIFQKLKRRLPGAPSIIRVERSDKEYEWLEKLKVCVKESSVVLLAEKDELSGIIGLLNCVRKEPNCSRVSCMFVHDSSAPSFDYENPLYGNQLRLGLAVNVYKNGKWGSYRHTELKQHVDEQIQTGHCYANVLQRGDLSTLTWIQGSIDSTKQSELINVQYASINFRDIMLATGRLEVEVFGTNRLDQECILGFEFAGVTQQTGERVMGTVVSGAMATQIIPAHNLLWKVPEHWSLQEAATCPVVYVTVYTAFFLYNPISKGKSVLIHAGSGGVGLAAIRVALAYGMEVYTTVSNATKKQFLLDTYPTLKESNIGNSRDCSFETMIKIRTNGAGVDYVLNSLSEDKLQASIRCLGRGGTFLEIGKFDLANDSKIGLGMFMKEIVFRSVLVDNLFSATEAERKVVYDLVNGDLKSGIIQPIFSTVFGVNELEKAYRHLSTGKHIGKIVMKIREEPFALSTVPIRALPRVYFDSSKVYVVPGGLGGFGMELADWMIIRGARKFLISSSRGITKTYQSYRIKIWESYGTVVKVCTEDITTRSGCIALLKEANEMGPVGGIFNLAVLLQDSIIENQTAEKFQKCMEPKAEATRYLDELSRIMCPQLEQFVIFSSVSCGRGNAGQANYGMANSVMERIIEQRASLGLPAKAIQWGAVGEVGLVADMAEDKLDLEIGGTLQQRISSCLVELDILLTTPDPIVASMVVAEKRVGSGGKDNIIESVLNIMGIRDVKSISMNASLSEVGMDSLMAVEIKQTLEREFEIFLTPQDLRALTFTKLQEFADARIKESGDNVKLKLASDKKVDVFNQMLRNLGDETTSVKTLLRLESKNNEEKFTSCLLVVPGIEGVAGQSWLNLAKSINTPSFILQLTETVYATSVPEITDIIAEAVKSQLFDKKEFFYLVGYSFGSFITLEIARILEEAGMKGNVLLVDGAPVFLKQLSYGHITSNVTDESIQLMLIIAIVQNMFPEESPEEIMLKLAECPKWEQKIDKLIEFGRAQTEYSEQYMRAMAQALFNRLKIVFNYDTKNVKKIKSPITLVRPTEVAVVDIDEDYELSRFTEGPVNLKFIDGNHTSVLDNMNLADIINDCDPNTVSDRNFMAYIDSGKNT